jgi:hypothetical protein
MAADDMARGACQPEGWARIRFEHSAVMWTRRATLLKQRTSASDDGEHHEGRKLA